MVLNIAKLALITGFAVMVDAKGKKGGKYGYRKDSSESEEITEIDDDFDADTFDRQPDSTDPAIDMLPKRLKGKKNKKNKKDKKGKKGCNEPDFAKGVLASIAETVMLGEAEGQPLNMDDIKDIFAVLVGEDFNPEGNKGFERGFDFGFEKLEEGAQNSGCKAECVDTPFTEECQTCCKTFNHRVDWNCGSTDPKKPEAKCCTEWSEECYTTDSEDNNGHACKDCYGYGRGYGGYGGYRGRRRAGRGYGRGRRRAGAGYGRQG